MIIVRHGSFLDVSDSAGNVYIPSRFLHRNAQIIADNFLEKVIARIEGGQYQLDPAPGKLRALGRVEGEMIRFETGYFFTLAADGTYRKYGLENDNVEEISAINLPGEMWSFKIYGDTLWVATKEDGLYLYSISNIDDPELVLHSDSLNYLIAIAQYDSMLATGSYYTGSGGLRILSCTPDGGFQQYSVINYIYYEKMEFLSGKLVLMGRDRTSYPTVIDIEDPANPQIVFSGMGYGHYGGVLYENHALIKVSGADYGLITYELVDLSDPSWPVIIREFSSPTTIEAMLDDSTAVSQYFSIYQPFTGGPFVVLRGNVDDGFEIEGVVIFYETGEFQGGHPPYFVYDNKLWELGEW